MALDGFHPTGAGPAAVAVHDEGDVLGDRTALQGRDEGGAEVLEEKGDRWEGEDPVPEMCAVRVRGHCC